MDNPAQAVERANSYRIMMESWSWKDFQKFMEEERRTALEMAIHADDIRDIQVQRGIVKAFDSIQAHLGYILGVQVE